MSDSIMEFMAQAQDTDDMLSDLLPRLSQLYDLRIKLDKAIRETDEAIDEIHNVFKQYGVKWVI